MRAKDIKMAAMVNTKSKEALITGAIDTNGITINAKGHLPEGGIWRIIKAETNLSDQTWMAWQISFGETISLDSFDESDFICRQFKSVKIDRDNNRVVFYDGEVRPGEPILKIFKIDLGKTTEYLVAHNRVAGDVGLVDSMLAGNISEDPVIEVDMPFTIIG